MSKLTKEQRLIMLETSDALNFLVQQIAKADETEAKPEIINALMVSAGFSIANLMVFFEVLNGKPFNAPDLINK